MQFLTTQKFGRLGTDKGTEKEGEESKFNYTVLQTPLFMNKGVMGKTAQLSDFDEQLYKITGGKDEEPKYLIATSEQPISGYHMNEWIYETDLPKRYLGFSTCFRKEVIFFFYFLIFYFFIYNCFFLLFFQKINRLVLLDVIYVESSESINSKKLNNFASPSQNTLGKCTKKCWPTLRNSTNLSDSHTKSL